MQEGIMMTRARPDMWGWGLIEVPFHLTERLIACSGSPISQVSSKQSCAQLDLEQSNFGRNQATIERLAEEIKDHMISAMTGNDTMHRGG
jgi:hypothetical protein